MAEKETTREKSILKYTGQPPGQLLGLVLLTEVEDPPWLLLMHRQDHARASESQVSDKVERDRYSLFFSPHSAVFCRSTEVVTWPMG